MPSAALDSPQGLDRFAERIRVALAARLDCAPEEVRLEKPKQAAHGEFAFPCFQAAKARKSNPAQLAAELADELELQEVRPSAAGPFLNFCVDKTALAAAVLGDARREDFGGGRGGRTILVEFSSPNIAKPMHAGHLRGTVIGAALARIFFHLGENVVRINHLGDWGSQFGKLVAAWNRWGDEAELTAHPIRHLLQLYVRYHEEEKQDPTLDAEAKQAFQALERGEENEVREVWRRFTHESLKEFDKVYQRLGIEFDFVRGESWYEDKLEATLRWLETEQVLEPSQGATIVDLEAHGISTPALVKTAHGTTLYITRDIAAARSRWEEFAFDLALYVVGAEQSLHFDQLKGVLARCGCSWSERIEHLPFGLVRLTEGKLSTREGRVLLLADVLDRAVELAAEAVAQKNPEHANAEQAAQEVGVGAVVFHELKSARTKEVVFDWKEVLSFEGDTGPYLQYTHARCCAILRKAGRPAPPRDEVDAALLAEDGELLVALGRFPAAVREAAEKREPMILAQHLLRVAGAGNAFYRDRRVIGSEPAVESARLTAVDALRNTLALGMKLLGVPAPDAM